MRAVHARLREVLVRARESLDRDPDSLPAGLDLLVYCRGFCAALSGHHDGEDAKLFPAIAARHPDLIPVVERLREDHGTIAWLLAELNTAMDAGTTREEAARHLDGIEAIMESHFRYEEAKLLDVLETFDLAADPETMLGTG